MNQSTQAGFTFVQNLAADLNKGDVKIPSFPDIVIRIKRALEDENCDIEKLTKVVSSDPALAARLLALANSALLQRGAKQVQDLRTAVGRLGQKMVRNTAMSVAVEQIFLGSSLGSHRERLREIFRESTRVAAYTFTLARTLTKINPDEALMAGLLHNVGKLYIIMQATNHPEFIDSDETMDQLMQNWHGQIGKAIIEGWGFSEAMADAAADHSDLERAVMGPADLTDIVTVASLLAQPAANEDEFSSVRAWSRLNLCDERQLAIIHDSESDIDAMAAALGG